MASISSRVFYSWDWLSPPLTSDDNDSVMPTTLVCTCGEWHRFPSSFFLHFLHGDAQLALKSSFTGQWITSTSIFKSTVPKWKVKPSCSHSMIKTRKSLRDICPIGCMWMDCVDLEERRDCQELMVFNHRLWLHRFPFSVLVKPDLCIALSTLPV